jgi:hypothetical protein
MQPHTVSSRELVLSIQRRLATLCLLERRLKERQATLRKAYTDSFKAHRTQLGTMSHGQPVSGAHREAPDWPQAITPA